MGVRVNAFYNAEMNRRIFSAAALLADEKRRAQRGAFWGQFTGPSATCSGVTRLWMHRIDGWANPVPIRRTAQILLRNSTSEVRVKTNTGIFEWAERAQDRRLQEDQVWFSVSVGRRCGTPRGILVVHFFNHQTHHRAKRTP